MEGGGAIGGAGAGNARQRRRNRRYAERVGSGGANGFFGRFMGHVYAEVERNANESLLTYQMRYAVRFFITDFIANSIRLRKLAIELTGVDIHGFFEFWFLGRAMLYLSIILCYIPLALFVRLVLFPLLWRIAARFTSSVMAAISGRHR